VKLTFLGHAAATLQFGEHEVLVDPFLTGNPKAAVSADALSPQTIVLTHAHADHVGDALPIAERCGATIVSSVEIVGKLQRDRGSEGRSAADDSRSSRGDAAGTANPQELGIAKFLGANSGGRVAMPFGALRFTPAWHSSSFADGTYGGMPMGVVFEFGDLRVYHAGDTALFGDMALIGRHGLDLALLPIGGHFTMGPEEALEAVRLLRPRHVVPIHYGTFDVIEQDALAFREAVAALPEADVGGAVVHPLAPGEALEL
jgi:L-ascorbate metabolism protein UlaG (beta-lactamase superfamily)